jgi:hypothetical protein
MAKLMAKPRTRKLLAIFDSLLLWSVIAFLLASVAIDYGLQSGWWALDDEPEAIMSLEE